MNILSAIYSGQTGFLKNTQSMALRASRIANTTADAVADNQLIEDMVGMKVDSVAAKANLNTIKIADNLLSEFVRENLKK